MKKFLFFAVIGLFWSACGSKTNGEASDTDTTSVQEVPDTLNTVEAVVKQVDAVYDYLDEMHQHYKEGMPSLDERFGTKEWQQVISEVRMVDRECECGGFFDFGDQGPLDPWTYDCYEGRVSADSIETKILPNGTAEVKFLVKDAVTIKGIPIRWLMRVEDGQWRVANIFFEQDDNLDLLMSMRAYADDGKFNKSFDIAKYLPAMKEQAAKTYDREPGDIFFNYYGLIDVDRDGLPEVYVKSTEQNYTVIYSMADDKPLLLANSFGAMEVYFFEHGVGAMGGCGTGCMMSDCTILKESKPQARIRNVDEYDMEGKQVGRTITKDGESIAAEEYDRLWSLLGEQLDIFPLMHEIEIETQEKPNLSDYAE